MSEPAEEAAASVRVARGTEVDQLQRLFGISRVSAQRLADAGYSTGDVLQRLTDPGLDDLGIEAGDLERIRTMREAATAEPPPAREHAERPTPLASPDDGNHVLDHWADSVRKSERPRRRPVAVNGSDSQEVLRKWVQGDDRALESWIQASDTEGGEPSGPSAADTPTRTVDSTVRAPEGILAAPSVASEPAVEQLREREEMVVRWLTELLDRVKTDQFDPRSLIEEAGESQRQLFEEKARRKQLEEELEHVKRGSIAVIKYVRAREARAREQALQSKDAEIAELRLKLLSAGSDLDGAGPRAEPEHGVDGVPAVAGVSVPEGKVREIEAQLRTEYDGRQQEFVERETELRRRIVQLEGDIRASRAAEASSQDRSRMLANSSGTLTDAISGQLKQIDDRERDLVIRENELRSKFEEIRLSAEELERKRESSNEREKELGQWEQQLRANRQAIEVETRKLEAGRADAENRAEVRLQASEGARLKDLQNQLLHKEAELKAREAFVQQRTDELEALQRQSALGEATDPTALGGSAPASTEKRVKSGVRRLDDLLFGGFQPGSQILLNGPAHTGKDVLARMFIAEGLKSGIPAIWVVTDKTYLQIREEMTALLPTYPEFEQKGMVRYVDLYSRSLAVTQAEPGVRLLSSTDKAVLDQVTQAVNNYSSEFRDKAPNYRLVFESVSTVSAYLDTTAMFRFLQPFGGRRKLDHAASYYLLETGMHSESDLQALEHMMDGSINLKVEQLKTFLSVKGLGETQSRAWIGYTFTKKAFSLGSFSLDHIR